MCPRSNPPPTTVERAILGCLSWLVLAIILATAAILDHREGFIR